MRSLTSLLEKLEMSDWIFSTVVQVFNVLKKIFKAL
jgi:hypothetical protein